MIPFLLRTIRRYRNRSGLPADRKKTVVLIGGLGIIGRILEHSLSDSYELVVLDIAEPREGNNRKNYAMANVANFEQLLTALPDNAYALVNLTALSPQPPLPDAKDFCLCSDVYVVGAYNVLLAAEKKGIKKVVFASTNHVTGSYEAAGISSLGREIRTDDYPLPDSAYGAMKLCAEQFGYLFSKGRNISVICLRIGTVVEHEQALLQTNERERRTILSKRDTVDLFRKAIEAKIRFGVYYGVSDNPGKPWDISNTVDELGFRPEINSRALLEKAT